MKVDLKLTDVGGGDPVALLHAFPLNRRMWEAEVSAWSQSFRVLAPDWRGFGNSSPGTAPVSMELYADDLAEILSDRAVNQRVILVGLSMGGYVAFEFARKYREKLRGLVLAATHPAADSEDVRESRYQTAARVEKEGTGALAERLVPRLVGETTRRTRPSVMGKVQALIRSNGSEGVARACYGLAARRDSTPILKDIQVPTLIVAGTEDEIIARPIIEAMHREIAASRLVQIEQCGHLINLEQPELFGQTILEFFRSVCQCVSAPVFRAGTGGRRQV